MSSTKKIRSPRERAVRFGLGAMVALALIGLWLWRRKHHPVAGASVAGAGVLLLAAGAAVPAIALGVRHGWMTFAGAIGWVNSRILLGLFFFVVVTPIALVRRIRGQEALRWTPGSGKSHWRNRDKEYDPKHYEHPY